MACPHCDHSRDDDAFARLDADFVRVLEDVIDTLIARHVINITDLPEQAQAKLFARKSFRERAGRNALDLFGNTAWADAATPMA
jgi:hypothetical protein